MSQDNVDFVRGFYTAGETMDREQLLDALPGLIPQICDPEIEWIEDPARADSRVYHGHDGVIESFRRWLENFDEYSFTLEEVVDCGDDVFVVARERARGAASGATADAAIYQVITMREGKVLRFREFYDEAAGRLAAGLQSPAPGSSGR